LRELHRAIIYTTGWVSRGLTVSLEIQFTVYRVN
jgi:hypothetical protein